MKDEILKTIRKEIRCVNCNKLLLKAKLKSGCSLEIFCPRCKTINEINLFEKVIEKKQKSDIL